MIGHTRIESIRYQRVPSGNQAKARFGHDQMQITGQATDGAIAIVNFYLRWSLNLETHRSAVATSQV